MRVFTPDAKLKLGEAVRSAPEECRPVLMAALKLLEERLHNSWGLEAKRAEPLLKVVGDLNSANW